MTKSSAYNSWQAVDIAVHRSVVGGRLPVRTGSGNIFNRNQMDSVGQSATVHRRLSESAGELRISDARFPTVRDYAAPSATCSASPTVDETVSSLVVDHVIVAGHVTGSVPDLTSASPGTDEIYRSESCLDVATSSRKGDVADDDGVARLPRLTPTDARRLDAKTGGLRWSWTEGDVHRGSQFPVQLRGAGGTSPEHVNRRRPRRRRVVSLTQNSLEEPTHTPTTTSCPTSSPPTDT